MDRLATGSPSATLRLRDRLRACRVLIVGAGGLGIPAAMALATAGVGTIVLADGDVVDRSNLHRQILYTAADIGGRKATIATARLAAAHPQVCFDAIDLRLGAQNFATLVRGFDAIIDATDQVASKYLINDGAVLSKLPFVHAGVVGFAGQLLAVIPRRSACLRCLFPQPPREGDIPTCQEAGVIGPVAATVGIMQATAAMNMLIGAADIVADRLFTYDALFNRWRTIRLTRRISCPLCGEAPSIRQLESIARPSQRGTPV